MAYLPASVRNNNPGAQWPGPIATKWGSTAFETLNDGQGNRIATFADPINGAAAHIDLLRSRYVGMSLADAINKWSGGNSPAEYVASVSRATGLSPTTPITADLLNSPQGLALVRAMAQHEKGAGGQGLSDEQWRTAQSLVFGPGKPVSGQPQQPVSLLAQASPRPSTANSGPSERTYLAAAMTTPPPPTFQAPVLRDFSGDALKAMRSYLT